MLFRRSTKNESNISQNFTSARAIIYNTKASSLSNTPFSALLQATQRGSYITFFTLVGGNISRRQVIFHVGR